MNRLYDRSYSFRRVRQQRRSLFCGHEAAMEFSEAVGRQNRRQARRGILPGRPTKERIVVVEHLFERRQPSGVRRR